MNHPTTTNDAEFPQSQMPAAHPYPNDEIDLGELIKKIWATRVTVFLAVFVVAALYIGFTAFNFAGKAGFVRYSQVFHLTFDGSNKGEFPNGTPFLVSDIVSPAVLNTVFKKHNLQQQGISLERFRRSISIEPYSPEALFIKQRFESQLNNKLTAAESTELQSKMKMALENAQSGAVRIFMTFEEDALHAALAQQVLLDIGQVWAENAINNDGVLKLDIPVYTAKIFDEERFENLDYLIGIELLLENIELIEKNIVALKETPASANVTDPQTGYSLEDLSKTIRDVKEYDLRQLMDPVKELGLTRNQEVVELYYSRQLNEMNLEKSFWVQRAELAARVMQGYNSGGNRNRNSNSNSMGVTPQLGDAFLDRLVELSKESGEQAYRQELTQQILEYQNKALTIEQRIEEIKLVLAALQSPDSGSSELRAIYLQQVQEALPTVLSKLRNYTDVVNRIHEQLSQDAVGSSGAIVMPQGGSFSVLEATPVTKNNILILIALCIGVGSLAMLFGLMRQMGRGKAVKA